MIKTFKTDNMKRLVLLMMMFTITVSLFAQPRVLGVEGTITDAKSGETLIGVTVQLKGTKIGTISDANGKYRLASDQLASSSVIVFSYIGFTPVEQVVGTRTVIDVKLSSEDIMLNEMEPG